MGDAPGTAKITLICCRSCYLPLSFMGESSAATGCANVAVSEGSRERRISYPEWFTVTQERIERFAEATEDRQWIHVDRERAQRESPYEATIAHGFLTLSAFTPLAGTQRGSPLPRGERAGSSRARPSR